MTNNSLQESLLIASESDAWRVAAWGLLKLAGHREVAVLDLNCKRVTKLLRK